ncbi:class I SAM-dependent methyltransferase [Saccharopolyspora gloriosae]|uniref:methyltransferase n=1 Tax=Saccharopolyspora gloriosae TaxID=455344 RepID=UPI001FB7E0AB|nr:class I SAM-dependent methyltransferase [Saccharopolyspora gloriosae]
MTTPLASLEWIERGEPRSAIWRSENDAAPPRRVLIGDDRLRADDAHSQAAEGTAFLWRGDFHNARNLLTAMARRVDRKPLPAMDSVAQTFHRHRQRQAQRARLLGMLLIPVEAGCELKLRRAPDIREACLAAGCPADEPFVLSLRELLGIIGAHEWRRNGIEIPALAARIHPHYGVFAPQRTDYVELLAAEPLPPAETAFDIGTGTGVLAALLARRGVRRVVATDLDPRALACAAENVNGLGLGDRIEVTAADLYPAGRAGLVVCNPPWVPAKPSAALQRAVYDPGSRMLRGFLDGLAAHLEPGGQGWLVLSDLAELLGLRSRDELLSAIDTAGLAVEGRSDAAARHPRAADPTDPLHEARASETVSLWRLVARD